MDSGLLRRAYDRDAEGYDARFRAQQRPKYEVVASHVPPPAHGLVLDLGGGTGLLRETLVELDATWARCTFLVADVSRGMLRQAVPREALAVQADVRQLPLRRASVERVLCVTGVVTADDAARALVSSARVCVPGGLVAFSLLPGEVPAELDAESERLGLERLQEVPCAGDRLFVWRRRTR